MRPLSANAGRAAVYLGVDLGTSAVKTVAVREDGSVAATASRPYPLATPRPGWAEQDPERWVTAAFATIREVAERSGPDAVRGIGLSGQMHTAVLVDAAGRPVRPAISWADGRAVRQVQRYWDRFDLAGMRRIFGNPPAAGFTGPSLAWVRDEEPERFQRVRRVRLAKDQLRFRLTGDDASDHSDASATLLFDPFARDWAYDACETLDLDPGLLPPLRGAWEPAGTLTREAAEATGLPRSTPVATGAGDQAAAALGTGLTEPGTLLATFGSGGQAFAPLLQPQADPELRVHLFVHAAADRWHLEGAVQNVGLALDWARRQLRLTWSRLLHEAASAPAGANGATFLPFLTGERTPWFDPELRGGWQGLALAHRRHDLARAAVEGTTFGLIEAILACQEAGAQADRLVVTGGGARTPLVRQIVADVLNRAVVLSDLRDASAHGAAVLAGAPTVAPSELEVSEPGPDREAHVQAFAAFREQAGMAAARSSGSRRRPEPPR